MHLLQAPIQANAQFSGQTLQLSNTCGLRLVAAAGKVFSKWRICKVQLWVPLLRLAKGGLGADIWRQNGDIFSFKVN